MSRRPLNRWLLASGTLALAALLPGALAAQVVTPSLFYYDGSNLTSFNRNTIFWEPTGEYALQPGFNLSFNGRPDPAAPCTVDRNGPTIRNLHWASSLVDTGIVDGADKWTPSCENWQGFTYARVHNAASGGGIGYQTYTGKKPYDESPAFWWPYGPGGDRYGANPNLMGAFGTFRFNLGLPGTLMRPWSGNNPDNDRRRMAVRSTQLLKKIQVQGAQSQVQQQFGFTVLNVRCWQQGITPTRPCQLNIVANTLVVNTQAQYTSNAHTFQDPAQGSIPVIYGPIPSQGQSLTMSCPGFGCGNNVWTSWLDPTQHGNTPWPGPKTFQIEISFNQLLRMLAVTTAARLGESFPTPGQIESVYGDQYANPQQWVLLDIGFGQEVHNKNVAQNRVYLGGNMTKLEVYAAE